MSYNPDVHKRRSIRLQGYDYSQCGLYFITICTNDRVCLFGKINDGKMILNDGGHIAEKCWLDIPVHFPNALLHEHIVMPNHLHGIIELSDNKPGGDVAKKNNAGDEKNNAEIKNDIVAGDDFIGVQNIGVQNIGVQDFEPLRWGYTGKQNQFQKIIPRSIGSIVRGFKIGVTKWFRQNTDVHNIWQRNYYEHIIRNQQSYEKISNYIIHNPVQWQEDKFYTP